MPEKRRKFDREFREGAVRIVRESGKPIAQVARDLGVHEGTLGNWVSLDRQGREGTTGLSTNDIAELKRLRAENAELRMERDVLKRSVVLWVGFPPDRGGFLMPPPVGGRWWPRTRPVSSSQRSCDDVGCCRTRSTIRPRPVGRGRGR